MNEVDALELVRAAIWTVIVAAGPAIAAAMLIGIAVALLQALTQIYALAEATYGRIVTGF